MDDGGWKVGDRAIVTGDEGDWNHRFARGTEVILKEWSSNQKWHCEPVEPYESTAWEGGEPTGSGRMSTSEWWVCPEDLGGNEPSPTEIAQLFGIIPKPHCETCTCHEETS